MRLNGGTEEGKRSKQLSPMSVADIPTGWSVTPWQISIIPDFQITLQALNENFKTDAGKEGISGQWYLLEIWPPRMPAMHFDVASFRSYRLWVGQGHNFGKCMEVIVKLGKTNAMTNTWGKTKAQTIFWAIPLSSLVSKKNVKAPRAAALRSFRGLAKVYPRDNAALEV